MRVAPLLGCVALLALLCIPTYAQQGWIPVQWDPAATSWDAVPSWDSEVTQRRTRLAVADETEFAPTSDDDYKDYDETLVPAPSEYQSSTAEGSARRRARPQRYNGVSQGSIKARENRQQDSSRSSRRSGLEENAEVTAPKPRVRTSSRAESQGRRRAETRTTDEPSTSAPYVRRGGGRTTEQSKESSTSAPRRAGVRGRSGYQRSTSTSSPDSTSAASNEASEATRRPSVRVRADSARRTPPSRAASANVPAKNTARRSQLPSSAVNETSSGEQQHVSTSQHLSPSPPDHNSTLTPAKLPLAQPSDPESATSIKSTRMAPLVDTVDTPIHIVVTPKPKQNTLNTISQKSTSTGKPISIILIPNNDSKSNPIKNQATNKEEINSVSPIVVSPTTIPLPFNKIQNQNKPSAFKINVSTNQSLHKTVIPDKSFINTTPSNKFIQVKSVTVISNTREEISIRPQKVNTAYSNVTPKLKTVTVIKSVTPKGDHGKAIVVNTQSSTAAPKTRQKINNNSFSSNKNFSYSTTPKSVITTERSQSLNSIIPITPAPKSSSKLVSVSLKSAVLDLSPPVTTPKTRQSLTPTTSYNPYNSIKSTSPRTDQSNVTNRLPVTNLHITKTDNNPNSRPTTTSDRPYPVFVPELHSSNTSLQTSNQQQVTSSASKRRKTSEVKEKEKTHEIDIDDDDNYPEEFKQRLLAGKKQEASTTPAPRKKDALLDVDNLVSKPRETTTTAPRKTTLPPREDSDTLLDIENLVSRPRETNTRLRSPSRIRDTPSASTAAPRRRATATPSLTTEAPVKKETSVRTAAAIRTRGELLRKSIRGRSTPQPIAPITEESSTETPAAPSTIKPRYSARQRRPDIEKEPETDVDNSAPFVQRFSAKYRSDLRGTVSSTPAYLATVPSVTQLPETDPAHRLAKFPTLSLRVPPKRWTPKSKTSSTEVHVVSTEAPSISLNNNLVTSSAQASTISEVSSPSQEPHTLSVSEVQVTSPASITTTDRNIIFSSSTEPSSQAPKVEVTSPKVEITSPKVEVTSRKVEITTPKVEVTSPKIEVTSLKSEPISTTRVRNIIYSSTTVLPTQTPKVEVTSPTSSYSRARNIIFSSTQEPLTHTLSIESIFPKSILSSRNLILGNKVASDSTTQEAPKVTRTSETYEKYSTTPIAQPVSTTPKINIYKPDVISPIEVSPTTDHTLTTRQATNYVSSSTEKIVTTRQATTPRSTTVQYTGSYSKVASIGLNPATTPIPSVVLGSSAPEIATPPPRFAMRIPIAPIGTKSSTPTPQTTTVRQSAYQTTKSSIPINTTQKPVSTSTFRTTTSTVKPSTTSVRPTATTPRSTTTSTTFKPISTSTTHIPSTTFTSTTTLKVTSTTSTTLKPFTTTTTLQPVTSTTQKPISRTTVRSTTPKPSSSSVRTTTKSTTNPPNNNQAHKHSAVPDPGSLTHRSAPNNTEAVIYDNEIPQFSLAAPHPARDLAARGLQFTSPSEAAIVTTPRSSPLVSTSGLIPISSEEPLTALSSSLSLSTESTSNITSTTERSTYIYKIPPNPNKPGRKGASRSNNNFRVLTTDTVPSTIRITTPSTSTTTETPVPSTTQFRWKPVTAAASISLQSESSSSRTQPESKPSKTLNILENLVQATKDKTVGEEGVFTVTPETPVSSTTEFEGLSLANLAYKSIVRNHASSTTPAPRKAVTTTTTTTTARPPSRGRKVPSDTVAVISDNSETQSSGRRPSNSGDANKGMALWLVPKSSSSSTTTSTTTKAPSVIKEATSIKDLPGELGGLTAQDLLLLEILSKRRPTGPATASPAVNFGGGLDLATLIAAGDNIHDEPPPPVRSTTRRPRITSTTTTTQAPQYEQYEPEPSGGGGGSGSSLLHILRAIGGASSVPQVPVAAPAPVKYTPQEDVILEPATTQNTRTRGRQRHQSGRRPVTISTTTTTEEPFYDVEPETNQQPSQLVTVAINVTKTVASLMGRVLQGAARTVSAVVRESTRQISGYLQNWQQPPQ